MRLYHEEQFGPVVPIARFDDIAQVLRTIKESWNGSRRPYSRPTQGCRADCRRRSTVVGRININTQCGRSPDNVPFSGRRSSSMGTMSVAEALRAFSVETVVAYSAKDETAKGVARGLDGEATMFAALA